MPATPLAVTLGDPAGIGPEIIAEAWRRRTEASRPFAVFGDPTVLKSAGAPVVTVDRLEAAAGVFREAIPVLGTPLAGPVRPGHPDPGYADAVTRWIAAATEACLSGEAAALVTAPISKAVLKAAGFRHPGHTEFLGELTAGAPFAGERGPVMMLAAADLRVTLATIHLPISGVAAALTFEGLLRTIRVTGQALARDFGCAHPRLAIAGLNPHAGESGEIGREEIDLIRPAVEVLRAAGMDVTGPLPADSLFAAGMRERFDAIVCMYHDQALIPVKMLDFWGGVNITLGLPIVRTSPDHGTAFDIAGRGLARPDSFVAALKAAAAIADRRAA
ncbi:MAG: 4-hydroxythreonine-4-phosphate dehydrogenase PdxA [Phenylobacterium sp.]